MRGIEKFAAGLFFGTLAVAAWFGGGLRDGSVHGIMAVVPVRAGPGRQGRATDGGAGVLGGDGPGHHPRRCDDARARAWDQNHGGGGGQQKTRTRKEAEAHKVKFPEVRAQLSKKQALQRGRETLKATQARCPPTRRRTRPPRRPSRSRCPMTSW